MKPISIILILLVLLSYTINAQGVDTTLYNIISERFAKNESVDIYKITFSNIQIAEKKESMLKLNTILAYLENNDSIYIELRLHTDCQGKATANKALSLRRSKNLQKWFVYKGISEYRIRAIGMGEESPLIDCKDCDCTADIHSQNRRLEVVRFIP